MWWQANDENLVAASISDYFESNVSTVTVIVHHSPIPVGLLMCLVVIALKPTESQFTITPPFFGHGNTAITCSKFRLLLYYNPLTVLSLCCGLGHPPPIGAAHLRP